VHHQVLSARRGFMCNQQTACGSRADGRARVSFCKRFCRYSGILFMIAAIILAASQTIAMIVIGRVFQGVAVRHIPYVITLQRHKAASLASLLTRAPELAWSCLHVQTKL